MALNILTTPQSLVPGYNPIEFTFSGNNFNQVGYRYVVDVYNGTTNALISRQKVSPLPSGSGKIDISRIISNYVDVDFTGTTNSTFNATNSYYNFYVKLGEEYKAPIWTFLLTSSVSAGTTVLISSSASTNTYVPGDQINVTTNTVLGNNFSDLYVVRAANSTAVTISNVWDTQNHTGTTVYADGRKVLFSNLVTSNIFTAFNGVKSFDDFITYSGSAYTLDATSTVKKALTNLPDNFYATPSQDVWVNAYISGVTSFNYGISGRTNEGVVISAYSYNILTGAKQIAQFNIGKTALNVTDNGNLQYYDVVVYKQFTPLTKTYRVYMDKRCTINNYEVAFMDRMGSISSFAFQLRSKETGTVTRTQYKAQVNSNYSTEDRGTKNIFIGLEKSLELNTNWLNDDMSRYFEELISSPYQWIKLDDNKYHACIVKETSFEVERQRNQKLIRKTVTIQLANNDSINI